MFFLLFDLEPAKVVNLPSVVSKIIGDDLNVQCTATGNPKPSIQWYFNNTLISPQSSSIKISDEMSDSANNQTSISTLEILNLNKTNGGSYTCTASNLLPSGSVSDSSAFTLEVLSSELAASIINTLTSFSTFIFSQNYARIQIYLHSAL